MGKKNNSETKSCCTCMNYAHEYGGLSSAFHGCVRCEAGCSWAVLPVSLDVVCRPAAAEIDFAAWWSEISRHVVPSAPWRSATCKQPPTGASANTSRRLHVLFVSRSSLEEAPSTPPPLKNNKCTLYRPCHALWIHCKTSQPVTYWQTGLGLIVSSGFIFMFVKYQNV